MNTIMAGFRPNNADSSNATTASFEICYSPGRGLGVFATRDISAGALIFTEKPLLTFRASKQAAKVYSDLRTCLMSTKPP
ncbi:SET and MYND domain-containing protein 4 [Microdochium nivale]|nr:SET and MYND domain-containing protein 4 [Microdochium nivale]